MGRFSVGNHRRRPAVTLQHGRIGRRQTGRAGLSVHIYDKEGFRCTAKVPIKPCGGYASRARLWMLEPPPRHATSGAHRRAQELLALFGIDIQMPVYKNDEVAKHPLGYQFQPKG